MKISHEVPLSLLNKSRNWNDYQYVLPHLLDKYPSYLKFILSYRNEKNSFIICDNGLFEGVTHTTTDLLNKINLIKPDIFIVPDEWNDPLKTFKNAEFWMKELISEIPLKTHLMVVMQGKTFSQIQNLYEGCKGLYYDYFAFNHSSKAYHNMVGHPNKLVSQMIGRVQTVTNLINDSTIEEDDYIHLLGCSLPQEFLYYDSIKIDSVDTSNPIICGALNIKYGVGGLLTKPTNKIEEFMEKDLTYNYSIEENVKKFREFASPIKIYQ